VDYCPVQGFPQEREEEEEEEEEYVGMPLK